MEISKPRQDREIWQYESFVQAFVEQTEDIFQQYDEMMMRTSEYWGNIMGYRLLDYVNDGDLEKDILRLKSNKVEVIW